MIAIEHAAHALASACRNPQQRSLGLLAGITFAILASLTGFLLHGGGPNGARFATSLMLFFSSIAFAAYYVSAPLSRLLPATQAFGTWRFSIAYGFIGMIAVFLVSILAPNYEANGGVSLPTLAFAAFSVLVAAAFVASAGSTRTAHSATMRSLQSLSSGYFWMVFALMDLDRMQGPHRPDPIPYGISLFLLVLALLVRFADAFTQHVTSGVSKRTI